MNTYHENIKETVRSFRDNNKFDFRWERDRDDGCGFTAIIPEKLRLYYEFKCFLNVIEKRIFLSLVLPVEYDRDQHDYIRGYLDCVNREKTSQSGFVLCMWQKIELRQFISYKDNELSVERLEQVLSEMILDAKLFLPVIEAIALDNPVPSDTGEPSRLFFEEYMHSQAFTDAEEKRLFPEMSQSSQTEEQQEANMHELRKNFSEALGIDFEYPDDTLEPDYGLALDEDYEKALVDELYSRFCKLTEYERRLLLYCYISANGGHRGAEETAVHFGISKSEVYRITTKVLGCIKRYSHFEKLESYLDGRILDYMKVKCNGELISTGEEPLDTYLDVYIHSSFDELIKPTNSSEDTETIQIEKENCIQESESGKEEKTLDSNNSKQKKTVIGRYTEQEIIDKLFFDPYDDYEYWF